MQSKKTYHTGQKSAAASVISVLIVIHFLGTLLDV